MKPGAFEYRKATNVKDVVTWLQSHENSKILAGGQSLVPVMNFRLAHPSLLVDINEIAALHQITFDSESVHVGALVRHQEMAESAEVRERLPLLAVVARHIGHWAVRNRGTLGGSLAHADPASEWPAVMVALGARFQIEGASGPRTILAKDFYLGYYTTELAAEEIITGVNIAMPSHRLGFAEVARRPGDFALAGAVVEDFGDGQGSVTWFGVAGKPERVALSLPPEASTRARSFATALTELTQLDADRHRQHLALTVAERAFQHSRLTGHEYLSFEGGQV